MLVSAGENALRIPEQFRLDRPVGTNRTACADAGTMTSTAGRCAIVVCEALRMESPSLPTDCHDTRLTETACEGLARPVGAKRLPGTDQPPYPSIRSRLSAPAKMVNKVAGRLLPPATRPTQPKALVSRGLMAEHPSRPPYGVTSSDAGPLQRGTNTSMSPKHRKLICYVDGFNLYHAIDRLGCPRLKAVDIWALAKSLLRDEEHLEGVEYFSAYATWLPKAYRRHQIYVRALQEAGVSVNMAHFKEKIIRCNKCKNIWKSREEKESDVRLALAVVEGAVDDKYDRAIIVSADSDLVPAVKSVKKRAAHKEVLIATPPGRRKVARDLVAAANGSAIEISQKRLAQHLFPEEEMPHEWRAAA